MKHVLQIALVGIALGAVASLAAVVPLPVLIVPTVLFCLGMIGWALALDARDRRREVAAIHGNGSPDHG